MSTNPYSSPTASLESIRPVTEAPPLWSPKVAAVLSFFFTPILGSIIVMKNWQAMGEVEKAGKAKLWIYLTVGVAVVMGALSGFLPEKLAQKMPDSSLGIAYFVVWYMLVCREQEDTVAVRFGKAWPKRSWVLPIVYTIGIVLAIVVVLAVVGAMQG
jgi:hypothetical protein